jgi:N-acetyl-gamma-glutamyl-phosphate reductase
VVRDALKGATRIAVPGCYPTACSLALAPGFVADLLDPDDVVIVAASGTSGAGKGLKPHLLGSEVMGAMSPYGVGGGHRHTPEIAQNLALAAGRPVTLSFTPTLAPMARGILATCTARVRPGTTAAQLREAWREAYDDEPFVHLLPAGQWPRTVDTLGANVVHLQLALDPRAGRVVVVAAIDNLTKGTAGAAVQSLNLALGIPETLGLPVVGLAP